MKWNKYTLKTRSKVEDIVISTLADAGVEGVEIEDKVPLTESDKKQMFVDILPDGPADDGIAYLNFYVEERSGSTAASGQSEGSTGRTPYVYGHRRRYDYGKSDRGQGLDQ